jgi:heme-degrading monooxygenase HmoA
MHARSVSLHGTPETVDELVEFVRGEVLPAVSRMEGNVGLSMLADRASGACTVTTSWDSPEAVAGSARYLGTAADRMGMIAGDDSPEVGGWEVVAVHRAHPVPDGAWTRVTWLRLDPARADDVVRAYRGRMVPELERWDGFCGATVLLDREQGRVAAAATYDSRACAGRRRARRRGHRRHRGRAGAGPPRGARDGLTRRRLGPPVRRRRAPRGAAPRPGRGRSSAPARRAGRWTG